MSMQQGYESGWRPQRSLPATEPNAWTERLILWDVTALAFSEVLVEIYGSLAAAAFCATTIALVVMTWNARRLSLAEFVPMLFPVYAVLLTPMSQEPMLTLRYGFILWFTGAAAIAIARAVPAVIFIRALAFALVATLPLHLAAGYGAFSLGSPAPFLGAMASKNYFATRMAVTAFAGLYLLSDRELPGWIRAVGLPVTLLSLLLLTRANSAGAILATAPGVVIFVALVAVGRLRRRFRAVIIASLLLLLAVLAIALLLFHDVLFGAVLSAFSKDAGLTGRDVLWAHADRYISERPWFGTGFGAFWVQGNLEPEGLWRVSFIGARAGFHFHNLYRNVAVETGIPGLIVALVLVVATTIVLVQWALEDPAPDIAFLMACHVSFLMRSYVEVDYPGTFGSIALILSVSFSLGRARAEDRTSFQVEERRIPVPRGRLIANGATHGALQ